MSERTPVVLRHYPLHKLAGFFSAVGWKCWANGILLHAGGERGLMIAWVRREKDDGRSTTMLPRRGRARG